MDIISGETLKTLMNKQVGLCLSLYMPTIRKGAESQQQNQIRFKNLVRKSEEQLLASDLRPSEVKYFMAPVQEIVGDAPFWRSQGEGLALFLSPDVFRYYRLPYRFSELVVVSDRFHLRPLLPIIGRDMEFFILAISQRSVRLFECTPDRALEVKLKGMPQNIDDALKHDTVEKRLQLHTGSVDTKTNILQYFKIVDKGLREHLRDRRAPLVFAGVDYLFPLYREANTCASLVEKPIAGNPEGLSGEELLELARPVVAMLHERKKTDAVAQYRQKAGTGLASHDIREIIPASRHGRIGTLLIADGVHQWGAYDESTDKIYVSDELKPGCEDLLDRAAIQTILANGTVYGMRPEEIPEKAPLAAIFRY
ncbi:MAG: hypothetical protein NT072_01810 [Deltaproteobacteria bacterium]|nr:hypothetical protein [Deltaproteobacteria bacterium]